MFVCEVHRALLSSQDDWLRLTFYRKYVLQLKKVHLEKITLEIYRYWIFVPVC